MWITRCDHCLRRREVTMKYVQAIDLATLLVRCDQQWDTSIIHGAARKPCDLVDLIIGYFKIVVTLLVHKAANELPGNHVLQAAYLVAIAQILQHDELAKLLVERHARHKLLNSR